jgi:hypothetical protein
MSDGSSGVLQRIAMKRSVFRSPCLRLLALPLAWVLGLATAGSVEYFVSPTGNDSAAGSSAAPWRTLQRAANATGPGVTVRVRTGIYREQVDFMSKSGSLASPIVFEAAPGESPVIDGSTLAPSHGASALVEFHQSSHIVFRGFELRNFNTTSQSITPSGIYLSGTCAHITLEDHLIHAIETRHANGNAHGIACFGDTAGGITNLIIRGNELRDLKLGSSEALVLNGNVSGFTVADNHVHHCDNIGIDLIGYEGTNSNASLDRARNGVVADNLVHDIDTLSNPAYGGSRSAAGIYVDGGADILIERNRVHRCNIGIEVASEHAGKAASRITVRENVLWLNHIGGIYTGGYDTNRGFVEDCAFTHNTLWRNDTDETFSGEVTLQHDVRDSVFTHNIIVAGTQSLMVANDFTANSGNVFDYNLYCHPAGQPGAKFYWKKVYYGPGANLPNDLDGGTLFAVDVESAAGLVDPNGENFRLQAGSYPVDRGDPAFVAAVGETDADGNARIAHGRVDLGAYEQGAAPPDAPGGLQVTPASPQRTAPLTWTYGGAGHTGFELQRATGTTGVFSTLAALPPEARAYEDAGVFPGQLYRYRIRALREGTASAFSDAVSVTVAVPASVGAGVAFTAMFAPADPSGDLRGLISFQIDSLLRMSGTLVSGSLRKTVSGQFNGDGQLVLSPIVRTGLDPLTVTLGIDFDQPALPVTGSATAGALTAVLTGAAVAPVPNPSAGLFTVALEPIPGGGMPEAPGYGHLRVPAKGLATLSLRLPDGKAVTVKGSVTRDGRFFTQTLPYRGGGWLGGTITISDDGLNDAHGAFHWHKAANGAEALYPGGFTGTADLIGSRHAAPGVGERLLAVNDTAGNAVALFGGSDLDPLPGDATFTLDAASRALFPAESGIRMGVVLSNGIFSGSFLDYSGTRVTRRGFGGVFLRRQNRAVGYYPGRDASGAIALLPHAANRLVIGSTSALAGTVANGLSFTPTVANGPATAWGISGSLPPGVTWNPGTHTLAGSPLAPGVWWVTVWAMDAAGDRSAQRIRIAVDSLFAKTAGVYRGLALGAPVSHADTALISLSLSSRGGYSGSLVLGGRRSVFRGVFDPQTGDGGALSLARRGTTPLLLELTLDQPGVGDSISGTLKADASLLTPAVDAIVTMRRTPWSRANPAPQAGRYTFVLAGGPARAPGYGSMTVSTAGLVSIGGWAGNGAAFKSSSGLSGAGELPLLALLNRGAGSLSGWVTHRDLAGSDADGALHWEDGTGVNEAVDFQACRFARPAAGVRVLGGFAEIPGNGLMTYADGYFDADPPDWSFTLDAQNRVRSADGGRASGMAINPATGLFSGFFPATVAGKVTTIRLGGAVLQKQGRGVGHFVAPGGARGGLEWAPGP